MAVNRSPLLQAAGTYAGGSPRRPARPTTGLGRQGGERSQNHDRTQDLAVIDIDRHGAEARALPRSLRTYLESSATRCTVLGYMRNGPRA